MHRQSFSSEGTGKMRPIETLRNLGPKSCDWLRAVGISSVEELEKTGVIGVYRLVKSQFPSASVNLLWGLAAGVRDRDWRDLTQREKDQLRHDAES